MTPAENEFIERQLEHLFQTDDCTLCERVHPDNALTSSGLTCDGTAALAIAKKQKRRAAAPVPTPVKHSEKPSAPVRAGLAELREAARRRRAA